MTTRHLRNATAALIAARKKARYAARELAAIGHESAGNAYEHVNRLQEDIARLLAECEAEGVDVTRGKP